MVDKLQAAFDRLTEKYIHRLSSSDEEIAVEYQLPTPSRKHKLKSSESPSRHKRKKRKSHSDAGEPKSTSSDIIPEDNIDNKDEENGEKKSKESHKNKHDKGKKKRKGHHRHGKHSRNHKRNSHKSNHESKRHGKKHRDREGKKLKQKKKKNKHHEVEPPQVLHRSASQESLESSNRSRSASPLPSIHTPSPSPTELDKPETNTQADPDFLKDKFDKIKERRRHAAKDAWDSLFDFKQKTDNQKQNLSTQGKEKNQKLRETIEKLKAKNEKYKDTPIFNDMYATGVPETDETTKSKKKNKKEESPDDGNVENVKTKSATKKVKKSSAKNESASEALEQAVKDISKWLDDAPKGSALSSPSDSPAQTISTEEQDNSRLDDELSQGEKYMHTRKDLSRKRPSSREPKVVKRREIQRTIDRLQPGKSKGNLLTNMTNKNAEKLEEVAPPGTLNKVRDNKAEESSPKLRLGSVLPTVEFTLGNDHNFTNDEINKNVAEKVKGNTTEVIKQDKKVVEKVENKPEEIITGPMKKDAEVETDPQMTIKPSQEKATPNLSAWFKAFGAPKATTSNSAPVVKKKVEEIEHEEKPTENVSADAINKIASPKATAKFDSPNDPNSPLPEGGDSPHLSVTATPRQRRTSTGSSVSERSSFSQDLDSPRHQMSLTSPLLRSPASPRTDDFQKITYPIINGTVRAGFYQDTTSLKSSPEKSCSPREAPQSPYSPYSQHVYASNNATGSATPNYFVDHNKSPLPTYGQNAPPYYDTSKAPVVNKPGRVHDDYTALGPDTFSPNNYNGPYSPVPSPYPPTQTTYSQPQVSPTPIAPTTQQPTNSTTMPADPKNSLFPVKKRTYTEPEADVPAKKPTDQNDISTGSTKQEYLKPSHSVQMSSASVDDIALALSEKSEMAKLNNLREKGTVDYSGRVRSRENVFENEQSTLDTKKEGANIDLTKTAPSSKKENIDMINMGYLIAENRRISGENAEIEFSGPSKMSVTPQPKGFEIEAIAINLGLNNQHLTKTLNKSLVIPNTTPAHTHPPVPSNDISIDQNIAHTRHNQFDSLPTSQINHFSLNDIELANKKLYACNTATSTATAIDYGNWKITNPLRKPEAVASDYSTMSTTSNDEKLKTAHDASISAAALNFNKNIIQHPQYSNYNNNISRSNISRTQELQQNLPAELRIPNPRGILKSDTNSVTSISNSDTVIKNPESVTKTSKADKLVHNHPLVSSLPYKTPYSAHSALPIETLRNLPNISPMLERYTNDERYLSGFASSASSLYHDKTFQMAQMFKQSIASDVLPPSTSVGIYSQPSISTSKDSIYKTSHTVNTQAEIKKAKRRKTSETKQAQIVGGQTYHSANNDVLSSVKSGMMSASPFNFGATTNMALGSMYADNGGFSIEDFRNSTNQLMAANYMAVAVAHQQRNNEANAEKLVKPAHQNSSHGTFPFLGTQVRAGYPFVGTEPSSPLYQQYIQRYQEELQRQTGAQIMGLYPPTYPSSLGVRQPYDSINRPSWL